MQLKIKKELLQKAISVVEKTIGRNLSLPVLNNILIKAEKNNLFLISTDLELAVIVKLIAKPDEEGSIVLNPRTLVGFLNNSPEGEALLKTKKSTIYIEQQSYKTAIKGFDNKEFPLLPKIDKKVFFTISSEDLTHGLNQVINSVSKSELKPELTGVFFNITKNTIKLAATDSFRLSEKTINRDKSESVSSDSFVLPLKTTQEIVRIYQDFNDILFFYKNRNQVSIVNEENGKFNIQIISKIIEGEYPNYEQIIPSDYVTKVMISKQEFMQQIKAGSLFSSRINDIEVKIGDRQISVSASNNDVGEYTSSIVALVEGEEQEAKFNYNYILDGLNNLEGDEVVFKVSKSEGPVIMESIKHKDYFYILMPIRK